MPPRLGGIAGAVAAGWFGMTKMSGLSQTPGLEVGRPPRSPGKARITRYGRKEALRGRGGSPRQGFMRIWKRSHGSWGTPSGGGGMDPPCAPVVSTMFRLGSFGSDPGFFASAIKGTPRTDQYSMP